MTGTQTRKGGTRRQYEAVQGCAPGDPLHARLDCFRQKASKKPRAPLVTQLVRTLPRTLSPRALLRQALQPEPRDQLMPPQLARALPPRQALPPRALLRQERTMPPQLARALLQGLQLEAVADRTMALWHEWRAVALDAVQISPYSQLVELRSAMLLLGEQQGFQWAVQQRESQARPIRPPCHRHPMAPHQGKSHQKAHPQSVLVVRMVAIPEPVRCRRSHRGGSRLSLSKHLQQIHDGACGSRRASLG